LTCKNFKEAGGDTPSLLGYSQPSLNAQWMSAVGYSEVMRSARWKFTGYVQWLQVVERNRSNPKSSRPGRW
jgi:hypothetical protein